MQGVGHVKKCLTTCCDSQQELKKYGVTTVVRVCEATYDTSPVLKEGIQVLVSLTFKPPVLLILRCRHDVRFHVSQHGVVVFYSDGGLGVWPRSEMSSSIGSFAGLQDKVSQLALVQSLFMALNVSRSVSRVWIE